MTPKAENRNQDLQPGRQAVARDGAVLPYILGRGRAAVQWVTPVLHWNYRNTKTSSFAFFSAIGQVCHGPVDEIVRIYVNGKPYSGVFTHRDASPGDYLDHVIPLETPGRVRFWWGQDTQTAADFTAYAQSLVKNPGHPEASAQHPSYKRRLMVGFEDFEAGQSSNGLTPSLPSIEIEVYRRAPIAYDYGHVPHGTHPIGAIYEILTDNMGGLGAPTSLFDLTDWEAKMERIMTDGASGLVGEDLFFSPVIADQRDASSILADALAHIAGWLTFRNGKISVDWYPNNGSTTSPSGLTELSIHDMIGEPTIDPDGLKDLITKVTVEGLDWEDADDPLCSASEVAQVPYAQKIVQEPRPEKYARPWVITRDQLRKMASIMAQLKIVPRLNASAKFRRESCVQPDGITPLVPGDRFNFDYTPYGLDIVCRVLERTESFDKAEVTLKFVSERGAAPTPYIPPLDPRSTIEPPDPEAPVNWLPVEAPPALELAAGPSVIVLAERPNTYTKSWRLHFAPTNSFPGQIIQSDNVWAISGVVTAGLSNVSTPGTLTLSIASEEVGRLLSQSATEQEDNSLLLYAGGEWLSVGTISPNGGGSYDVDVARGRLGSSTRAIATTERLYFIYRDDVPLVAHANFLDVGIPYNGTTATKYFKLEAFTGAKDAPITSAVSLQLRNRAPGVVTGLTADGLAGAARLEWVYPQDEILRARIYESSTTTKPADPIGYAFFPEATYTRTGLTAGLYYYWVELEDEAGNISASSAGPVSATALVGSAGAAGYSIPAPATGVVACNSAGTPNAGEVGSGGRVRAKIIVGRGPTTLTGTSGTPSNDEFKVVITGTTNCTAIMSGVDEIELSTISADTASVAYEIQLESPTTVYPQQPWEIIKAKNGPAGTGAVTVYITAPAQAFTRANSGASYSPATITLTAALIGATATTWAWQYWNGASWTAASGTNNASTYVVSSGDFSGSRTYRCEINSAYANDEYELYHITGGADGTSPVLAVLDNQVHAVPASSAGVVGSWTNAGGNFKVQVGNVDVTTSATFSILTNASSLTASIGSTTGIYSVTGAGSWANASLATEIVFRAVYLGVNYDRAFRLTKTLTGATGTGAPGNYVVRRYMASSTVPSTPSSVNAPAGWTTSMPTPAGNQVVFFVEAYFNGSTNNITGAWSTPVRVPGAATFYATSFPAGIIAAGDYCFRTDQGNTLYQYDGSTWVDRSKVLTQADFGTGIRPVQLVTSLPSLPSATYPVGSVVLNTTDSQLYENKAGSWSKVIVDTASLTGTISAAQIAAGAITAGKIAANAVTAGTIAAGVVTATTVGTNQIIASAANIADAIITSAKIVSLDAGKLTAGAINAVLSLTTGGEFVAGTGDSQLRATTTGTTVGNTANRHIAFPTTLSGSTAMEARAGGTMHARIGAVGLGGSDYAGRLDLYTSINAVSGSLTASALSLGGTTPFVRLGGDAEITRSGSYAIGINSATTFSGGSLAQRNSANTYDNFKATQDTAVDVTGVNFRVLNSSGVQKMRVDNATGDIYLAAGARILINNVVVVS